MSKGRHVRKSSGGGKIGLIIILVLFAAALVYLGIYLFGDSEPIDNNPQSSDVSTEESNIPEESSDVTEESTEASEEESSEESSEPESSEESTEPSEDTPDEESEPAALPQQVDAEYEKWLASAMVMGISMDYTDFEIKGIYATAATKLADKADSQGVYVVFTADGADYAIFSRPIDDERDEAGTNDISSMTTGFATFDLVDVSEVPTDSLVQYTMDDLQDTIAQSMLVSVYYH